MTRVGHFAYPTKPVRMIVPLAPGGGSDIIARLVASALSEHWGETVVVDNRPGAGSTVGTAIAAKAPADGYTLLVSSSSMAISPSLYRSLDFSVSRDFDAVTLIACRASYFCNQVFIFLRFNCPIASMWGIAAPAGGRESCGGRLW